ncbi:MAG: hypothetical protein EOM06_07475 [Sphingobacteriia bacterium]|nr:hypothetical protein [Sphingobacteriia bacterium]
MKKRIKFILLLIIQFLFVNGLFTQNIPELKQHDLPEMTILSNRTFDGNALWGYMNGGADLYLEYGFSGLRVQEITIEGEKIKLEIFLMKNPLSAFGIMSIKRFKCNESSLFSINDCLTNYQYHTARGSVYLNVINFSGSKKAIEFTRLIASKMTIIIDDTTTKIPAFSDVENRLVNLSEIKFVKGTLGLQNGISGWIRMFDEISDFEIYYLPVKVENNKLFFADIHFNSQDSETLFLEKNFSLTAVWPYFHTYNNKLLGLRKLTDKTYRMVEITGSQEESEEILKKFGF